MVSPMDKAKRVLVTLLKSLAGIYGVVVVLTRESTEVEVKAAYKKCLAERTLIAGNHFHADFSDNR